MDKTSAAAKSITRIERKEILQNMYETEIHKHLKELFQLMEPDYLVEVTHGVKELGKDLVLYKKDKFNQITIGVIVKVGSIKGKTLGDIDKLKDRTREIQSIKSTKPLREIYSQVEQAIHNPANLKTVLKSIPVNKIIIVLIGEMAGNAKDRLFNEFKEFLTEIYDLNKLIDLFTEYYPQVFFEANTFNFIHHKITQFEMKHWFHKKDKNLTECFVNPIISPVNFLTLDEQNMKIITEKRKLPFSHLETLLIPQKRILLAGDIGTGKTSALLKVSIDYLKIGLKNLTKHKKGEVVQIPIFINAIDLLKIKTVEELKLEYFKDETIYSQFSINGILVDGLDEIISKDKIALIEKADKFAKELNCALIITSRKVESTQSSEIVFEKYEILPFELNQAFNLLKRLSSDNVISIIKDGLEKMKYQIPLMPLSLMFLIELIEEKEHKEIPATVTELYERFLDMILGKWDTEKGLDVLFEYHVKKKYLASLSYSEFFQKKQLEISIKDFKNFNKKYAIIYGWDKKKLDDFIKEVFRAGILEKNNRIIFKQRSFLDYFVAFYLNDKREEIENINENLVNLYYDEIWSEVAFFYFGLRREINENLVKEILFFKSNQLTDLISKYTIGRLIQAAWHSKASVKKFSIQNGISYSNQIREKFLELTKSNRNKFPGIFADFILINLSEISFKSSVLYNEILITLDEFIENYNCNNSFSILLLLWSIKDMTKTEVISNYSKKILHCINDDKVLTLEDRTRLLLILDIIITDDKVIERSIKKKLKSILSNNPKLFKKLLPIKQKGFRK